MFFTTRFNSRLWGRNARRTLKNVGSSVLCAPLGRVSVSTIGRYVGGRVEVSIDSRSPYRWTCRSTCWTTIDRYIGRCIGRPIGRYVGQYTGQYTGRHSADTGSVSCRWKIGRLSMAYRSTVVQYMYNIICVLKSEQGSWVPVLHASYCRCGVWKLIVSTLLFLPGQPRRVNLLDFCRGSTDVITLDCCWIPLKGDAKAVPMFSKKINRAHPSNYTLTLD